MRAWPLAGRGRPGPALGQSSAGHSSFLRRLSYAWISFYDISIKYFDEVLGQFEDARQNLRVVHSTVYDLPKSA